MARISNLTSFSEKKHHFYDNYKNQGYQYENNIMRNVLSPEMFANPLNDVPMRQIERLIENLINAVRKIKLHFAITFDKNSKLIN